jgi:hypothetical protein
MEVTYELTQRDVFDSLIAHRSGSAFRKWTFRLSLSLALIVGGTSLLELAVRPHGANLANFALTLALAAIWAVFLWAGPWWRARNLYLKQPSAQGPITVLADAGGLHWRWNGGSSDLEWKHYIRHLESKRQFLLYSSPVLFIIVPKRALTPEQVSEFRTLLAQNLSRSR